GEHKRVRTDHVKVEEIAADIDTCLELVIAPRVRRAVDVVIDIDRAVELRCAAERVELRNDEIEECLLKSHQGYLSGRSRVQRKLRLVKAVVSGAKLVNEMASPRGGERNRHVRSKPVGGLAECAEIGALARFGVIRVQHACPAG